MSETSTNLPNKDFNQLRDDVKEIKDALLGNAFKKKGIIDAVNEHTRKIEDLEEKWKRLLWIAIGAGAGGGISVFKILEALFK